jgi:signal transduction histidine kinase
MHTGLDRVAAIVGAMRQFAHPRGDAHASVDINAALESTLVVTHAQYKYVADVETDLAALPPVLGDVGELNQVFVNLIVNAAHAIADTERRGTIRIGTRHDGNDVVITIADTGCGIPADRLDRIFDPFFTTKDVGRGTGQGLAITRSIIERHAGSIDVRSEVGSGTTFELRFPAPAG